MKEVLYCLPDSAERVVAFILCEEGRQALLFIPPVTKIRGATITIAESQNGDGLVFEDSVSNSFVLKDWGAAATMAIFLLFVVKDNLIERSTTNEN
jgi:hypothetical protein